MQGFFFSEAPPPQKKKLIQGISGFFLEIEVCSNKLIKNELTILFDYEVVVLEILVG